MAILADDMQDLIIAGLLYGRFKEYVSHLSSSYFTAHRSYIISLLKDMYYQFGELPSFLELSAKIKEDCEKGLIGVDLKNASLAYLTAVKENGPPLEQYVLEKLKRFILKRSIEILLEQAPLMLKNEQYEELIEAFEKARTTMPDFEFTQLGKTQLKPYARDRVPFGIPSLDVVNAGLRFGELAIVEAPTGVGKSAFLVHLAVNYALLNYNVVIVSLEMDEQMYLARLHSYISGVPLTELEQKADYVSQKIERFVKKSGAVAVKQLPAGSSVWSILLELDRISKAWKAPVHILLVDYLQIVTANYKEARHIDLGLVTTYLRGKAVEKNMIVWVASQTKQEAEEREWISPRYSAESYSAVHVADLVLFIQSTQLQRRNNELTIGIAKCRYDESGIVIEKLQRALHCGRIVSEVKLAKDEIICEIDTL